MSVGGLTGVPFICTIKGKIIMAPTRGLRPVVLQNVYVSGNFPATFVSESWLTKAGCSVLKKGSGGLVADVQGEPIFAIKQREASTSSTQRSVPPPGASAALTSLHKSPKVSESFRKCPMGTS